MSIGSHGTLVARSPLATNVFTNIGYLGDITPPQLSRNTTDVSTQNDDIDHVIVGILRRSEVTFPINFLATNPTHDHLTGLYKAILDKTLDEYRITTPDGFEWRFRAYVSGVAPEAPVDGAQRATITLRPTGPMRIEGVDVGGVY